MSFIIPNRDSTYIQNIFLAVIIGLLEGSSLILPPVAVLVISWMVPFVVRRFPCLARGMGARIVKAVGILAFTCETTKT